MRTDPSIITTDCENGLTYKMGLCSIEYCIYLLNMWIDVKQKESTHIRIPLKMSVGIDRRLRFEENEDQDWKNALVYIMRIYSIKIISSNQWDIEEARKKKVAYSFELMYKTGLAILESNNLDEIFSIKFMEKISSNFDELEVVPHREYRNDVIDYYRLALSSNDPYIKFISFYHIIEYFYDEIFKQRIIDDLQDKLTQPDFSYKNGEKLYNIAKFIKNRMKMNDELGNGNELESLRFVLEEFVNIEDLKVKLNNIDKKIVTYYNEKKVSFCKAPTVQWADSKGVYTSISKRIYSVRNALIHSKSGKNDERYKPYKDEKSLQMEIPLIKVIAEMVIISSSKIV